ncbi:MAG: VanZ family protein [Candidatus Aminicenantes bacterium]|nr:VanZ family protein [Candidatus Aminicenantes bacterium]
MPSKKKMFFSWLWVALCILSIFLIVPIARSVRNFVEELWNVSFFGYSVLFTVCAAFLISLYFLWFRFKIRAVSNYLWLAAVALIYVYFTLKLWKRPEEAIHFLEYGLLGLLLFQALRHRIDDKSIYMAAFLIGGLVGIFDEVLQWMIPRRIWDMRDIGLNALSCGLCQIAIWKGIKPKLPSSHVRPKSFQMVSWFLVANFMLLSLSLSNTPKRVKTYSEFLPFLSFLQKEEPMTEDIHKHRDPDIGIFYSRLTLEELKKIDKERAEEYGFILDEWSEKKYVDFLEYFPGYARPFLHEIRVHIFRRDVKYREGIRSSKPEVKKENLFIAYKENLILEKYFGQTLQKSRYKWPQRTKEQVKAKTYKTSFYKSPVSATTYFPLDEKVRWAIVVGIAMLLFIFNIWFSRRKKLSNR